MRVLHSRLVGGPFHELYGQPKQTCSFLCLKRRQKDKKKEFFLSDLVLSLSANIIPCQQSPKLKCLGSSDSSPNTELLFPIHFMSAVQKETEARGRIRVEGGMRMKRLALE